MKNVKQIYLSTFLFLVLAFGAALAAACSTKPPTSPSETATPASGEASMDRRVGTAGGSDGACGGDEPCDVFGRFLLTAPNGDTLFGTLDEEVGWVIAGGTGLLQGSSGFAFFERLGNQLRVSFSFSSSLTTKPPLPANRSVLAVGTLQLTDTRTSESAECTSGLKLTETYRGTVESIGLVTLELESCAS